MINISKYVIGIAIAFAILFGLYVNKPKIKVTAEATANATSTVIVPTSTKIVTVDATTTADVAPQTVYIHNTYVETKEVEKPEQKPVQKPVETVGSVTTELVPAPTFSNTAPLPTPVTTAPVIVVNPTPVTVNPTPVYIQPPTVEPQPEPIEVKPTYTEYPKMWVEARNNGDWLFFQGNWPSTEYGTIKCDGLNYGTVRPGFPKIIEVSTTVMADYPPGTFITCTFSLEGYESVSFYYTTK